MSNPKIAGKNPVAVTLEPGTHFWCACGQSKNQPFCDGSHRGTEFAPTVFRIDKRQEVFLCQCKQTGNKPFCDGSHRNL